MARVQLRRQQTECCDHRQIDFVRHGDKLRTLLRVEFRNRRHHRGDRLAMMFAFS